jgi:hypothetical protein
MADYTATAISEGDHWVIDVQDVAQADSVEDLEEVALGLVVEMTHVAPEEVHIELRIV